MELEAERRDLQEELQTLRSVPDILEAKVQAERELSDTVAKATLEAMESLEGVVADLGAMPLAWKHAPAELDITLGRLCRAGEVCLPTAQAYGDHCARAMWMVAFVLLQRGGCEHVNALEGCSLPLASTAEIAAHQLQARRCNSPKFISRIS